MIYYLKKYTCHYILLYCFVFLTSCGSHKQTALLYDPTEVNTLSNKLGISLKNSDKKDDKYMPLYAEASLWLGTPYRYGGISKKGVDCSGLTYQIFKQAYGRNLPRSTSDLEKKYRKKISKNKLEPGDLLFFATTRNKKKITHVGIFLKDGYFVHASTSRGVVINHINEDYYERTWKRSSRVL